MIFGYAVISLLSLQMYVLQYAIGPHANYHDKFQINDLNKNQKPFAQQTANLTAFEHSSRAYNIF